ncbi:HD domain-containing protein [Dictyobacter formicarum]|uniref:Phosphohydrolase n=1 Tax=Dictyobacter formicarum TaxID=2778368 RepID=A0ABQ3V943_9CHLR|nr:HD domain-containing protein [Dictyobacter formicarum]GHO82420.1 phosphohydrolase [Dictyobacter formicarum]
MPFHELPPEVLDVLANYAASPRLVAHLTVVHDVAVRLITRLDATWPLLEYDKQRVLFGAATHDVGKTVYLNELTGPGTQHEEIGPQLLLESGFPETYARFARTHARWSQEASVPMEDALVAFADTIWKGKRDDILEREIAVHIARQYRQELWEVYMKLDDIAIQLAKDAHDRILWQGKHPI